MAIASSIYSYILYLLSAAVAREIHDFSVNIAQSNPSVANKTVPFKSLRAT
jgi:hypothetical protein